MNWGSFDVSFAYTLSALRTSGGVRFFALTTELGSFPVIIALTIGAALWFAYRRRSSYVIGLILTVGGGFSAGTLLKLIVARPRPFTPLPAVIEDGFSFPSTHALAAIVLYGFLALAARRLTPRYAPLLGIIALILILAIGFSRLYLGVHYVSDVAAGYAIGALFVWLGTLVARRYT